MFSLNNRCHIRSVRLADHFRKIAMQIHGNICNEIYGKSMYKCFSTIHLFLSRAHEINTRQVSLRCTKRYSTILQCNEQLLFLEYGYLIARISQHSRPLLKNLYANTCIKSGFNFPKKPNGPLTLHYKLTNHPQLILILIIPTSLGNCRKSTYK